MPDELGGCLGCPTGPRGAEGQPGFEPEVAAIKKRLYQECYHGHLPEEFWTRVAAFCLEYALQRHTGPFPFRRWDCIQHASGTGDIFVVRLVDDAAFEAYAENLTGHSGGTRVINPGNWKKVAW